ncbi:MAG TPA: apolipoprotein N-acyltransferase, partial [Chromatiales bacterium]|nr:apolipoprotein N-acyltransferase [Chromatiales bacterium]
GLGQFGLGVSWVYESFTLFGGIVGPLAALVTALFVMGLAFYPAVAAWLAARVAGRSRPMGWAAAFVASWVLLEAGRAWLFGGFPWLNLGISQVDGPLAGWLPLVGEYGVTALLLLLAALSWQALRAMVVFGVGEWRAWLPSVVTIAAVLSLSLPLHGIKWSVPTGKPLAVGLVQGNVAQMQKFDPDFFDRTIDIYRSLTDRMPDVDLVVWPETAIPRVIDSVPTVRDSLEQLASERDFSMLVGTFTQDESGRYYNTLLGVPRSLGSYRKHHLVPFGEYFPMRWLIERMPWLFEVPMSDLSAGPATQPPLVVGGRRLGASICFEADFSRDIRRSLPEAEMFVTVSNDSWFGESFSPHQHLQMARARAIEFQRPMIRATNTGISAVIDTKGRVQQVLGTGERGTLVADLTPRRGSTPLARWGAWPTLAAMLLLLVAVGMASRRRGTSLS